MLSMTSQKEVKLVIKPKDHQFQIDSAKVFLVSLGYTVIEVREEAKK